MNTWEVIIYKERNIWNWKANEKDSDLTIPVFGKTFDSEVKAKKDWKRYAGLNSIKNYEYVTEKSIEE